MKIHPLWFLCITVRILLILLIRYFYNNNKNKSLVKTISLIILLSIGFGFMRKGLYGSNNEMQIAKVFWHETRYVHGSLYLLSSIYLFNDNLNMASLILLLDIIFSIIYRFFMNK
jgi:L-cystine uptake protein TcyP (sodium:dicarboxylate symporter family)